MTEKLQRYLGYSFLRAIAETIEEDSIVNFMTFDICSFGKVKYEVTFRRADGMTPLEYINELRKRIIDLECEIKELRK